MDRDSDGKYAELRTDPDEPILLRQKVGHDPRIPITRGRATPAGQHD